MITTVYLDILAIPYGSADKLDRTKEYFSRYTQIEDHHKAVFHDHDMEHIYGFVMDTHRLPDGIHMLAVVTINAEVDGWLLDEILADRVYASSGTGQHPVTVSNDGHIDIWPCVETSLVTPYAEPFQKRSLPANWRSKARVVKQWRGKEIIPFEEISNNG